MRLVITDYLIDDLPPLDLVTWVRCVVLQAGAVLVARPPDGPPHILPGGRREPGETLEDTLRRELLEETGWTVAVPRLLGCRRFRHLTPKTDGYPFPYPEFVQLVYIAQAEEHHPEYVCSVDIEGDAAFVPVAVARELPLTPGQHLYLTQALAGLRAPDTAGGGIDGR